MYSNDLSASNSLGEGIIRDMSLLWTTLTWIVVTAVIIKKELPGQADLAGSEEAGLLGLEWRWERHFPSRQKVASVFRGRGPAILEQTRGWRGEGLSNWEALDEETFLARWSALSLPCTSPHRTLPGPLVFLPQFLTLKKKSLCFSFGHATWLVGILVCWPGIESRPSSVEAWSPTHWNTREFL